MELSTLDPDLCSLDPALLKRWNVAVPRYTSYPTALQFDALDLSLYQKKLHQFDQTQKPLSLYIHIPFCRTMCLFCGCSVVLNRKEEVQTEYVRLLLQEINALPFQGRRPVTELHFGGGTPTSLREEELDLLMESLRGKFSFPENAELSIEIDPRTVVQDQGKKLKHLRRLGFTRVSFGVQDLDWKVQEAVKRRQSAEMTFATYEMARALDFDGINLDLIYGLPFQTRQSFAKTAHQIAAMRPDRISFFSYARVPWLKGHQKAIRDEWLPDEEEKFGIYVETRRHFMQSGYVAIGMDHFALEKDPIALAYQQKKITRNFQGYAVSMAEDMIGLGVSSIGFIENGYFQNSKTIASYRERIQKGLLPVERGYLLHEKDLLHRWVIQKIMCEFSVDKRAFFKKFQLPFDIYFQRQRVQLDTLCIDGFIQETKDFLIATALGRLFVRRIAAVFDAYLQKDGYSKVI